MWETNKYYNILIKSIFALRNLSFFIFKRINAYKSALIGVRLTLN